MHTLPKDIHVGMTVYDNARNEIGKVEDFRFSENEDDPDIEPADIDATDRHSEHSLIDDVTRAFLGDDQLPEVLRDRLLTEGFVRLDANGLFATYRHILPDQIDSVRDDALTLNVSKDELMKWH